VYGNDPQRTSATDASLSPPSVRPAWYTPVSGRISSQALVAQDEPVPGRRTVYVATSKGVVYALAENGYVRWRVDLGQLDRICQQIDGYGVTGTPAIDVATHALYVADAFGRLHALDLTTGAERAGWPIRVYPDFRRELVWGALAIVQGSVYLGTGSYCDRKMEGKLFRVELASGRVASWTVVPKRLGGGGGIWGWGGVAYSAARDALYAVTGNAFRGGTNTGRRFRESAGYGEQLVELGRDLSVRASNHPKGISKPLDLDFVGSPVLFSHPVCGELAAALNKNGRAYVWRAGDIRAGPLFSLQLSRPTLAAPLLSQPAYSPRTGALYVVTPGRLVRIDVDRRCRGRVAWGLPVGGGLFNGSPTVAGGTVWLVENAIKGSALVGVDAVSGKSRLRARLAGPAYVAPTVVGDRIYVGTYTGGVQGFALVPSLGRLIGGDESPVLGHRSAVDLQRAWASREDGVYATDDAGRTWRLVYPRSAIRVARVSATSGMISVGDRVSSCGCRQIRLWTADGGSTWHATTGAMGEGFTAAAGTLWWWRGGGLYRAAAWPPGGRGVRGVRVARVAGAILDVQPVPGGVAVLATRRVAGFGYDRAPTLVVVRGRTISRPRLPRLGGEVLARSLEVAWPRITVRGADVTAFTRSEVGALTWTSGNGGRTWSATRT
jgi:hypothetical protein